MEDGEIVHGLVACFGGFLVDDAGGVGLTSVLDLHSLHRRMPRPGLLHPSGVGGGLLYQANSKKILLQHQEGTTKHVGREVVKAFQEDRGM